MTISPRPENEVPLMAMDLQGSLWGGDIQPQCLIDAIVSAMDTHGDRIAVVDEKTQVTYAELFGWAARIAADLNVHDLSPGDRIAIACHRSAEAVAALIAVTLAGYAYVPLDMEYPRLRLEHMLNDSKAKVMLHTGPAPDLDGDAIKQAIVPLEPGLMASGRSWIARHDPDLPVYVIYTSGSTGWPKGVELQHSCLDNVAAWQAEVSPAPDLRTAQFAPLNFDVSYQEIFGALSGGGTLVVMPERMRRDPIELLEWLAAQRIQRLFLPFVALQMLAEAASFTPGMAQLSLAEVNVAGEQLVVTEAVRAMFGQLPQCRLVNHYGQSESAMVTYHVLTGHPDSWPLLPPIGIPLPGCELLLDTTGQDEPDVGELLVAGLPVAIGYLGQPELNARRYATFPATRYGSTRAFRTRDLVRFAGGQVQYLTRMDDEVKLRGIRISLAEVDAQLMAQPEIASAVTVIVGGDDTPRSLHAAVTLKDPAAPLSETGVLARLSSTLPEVSRPLTLQVVTGFPRTPSGKLDRDAVAKQVDLMIAGPS